MSDNEKQSVQRTERGIGDMIWSAYNSLARVRVVTCVGDVNVVLADRNRRLDAVPELDDVSAALVTETDLVEGDILNAISSDLLANTELRAFHAAQVEASLKVVPDNVRTLIDAAQSVIAAIGGGESGESSGPAAPSVP